MNQIRTLKGHAGRIQAGKILLTSAESLDTTLVAPHLAAFNETHTQFVAAVAAVDAAQAAVVAATDRLGEQANRLDAAFEKLLGQLVADGQPRLAPLAAWGADTPSAIRTAAPAVRIRSLQRLTTALIGDERLSPASRAAATNCSAEALALDTALSGQTAAEDAAGDARNHRNALADRWDDAFAALKRGARAAADDGAPALYAALFDRIVRPASPRSRPAAKDGPAKAA